jgi:DinB superfamily
MTATELYRNLLRTAHDALEGTMAGLTAEQATWDPPGKAFSIAANYVHVVASEDTAIQQFLRGREPLAATSWAGRTGVSEMPASGPGTDLKAWSRRSRVDLPVLQRYAHAVYAATDEHLAAFSPTALTEPLDLSVFGLGQRSVRLCSRSCCSTPRCTAERSLA